MRIGGLLHATPLLFALATIELSDIVFAVDSVPAIFALTSEPLIVYTSNVCAILVGGSILASLIADRHRRHGRGDEEWAAKA